MALNEKNRLRFVAGMNKRITDLRAKTEESLDFAIDTMFHDRVDSYLRLEQGLAEVDRMLHVIEADLEDVYEFSAAQRLESRLEFIEDRFDEFDSEIRQRPRRRRKKINLFNFFKTAGAGGMNSAEARGEITSAVEAYKALRVEFGSPMPAVTRAFRQQVKKIHPDIRNGDRSSEPELRRIIEAYQFLKQDYEAFPSEPHNSGNK
jgi:hypothetical protein